MIIASLIIIILIYRWYLHYRKQNDLHAIEESRKIYLNDFFSKHFRYFNLLSEEEKQEFILRASNIRNHLEFNAVNDLMISENIKILISASFTQITFGYDTFKLDNFTQIFLHPSVFFSRWVNRDVRGLTYSKGRIDWSWEDFVKGYMFNDDKLNLALHELAHALQLQIFENPEVDSPEYEEWISYAKPELERMISNPEQAYFRAYAASNLHEFFAVNIEYFFEDPEMFRQKLPQLYKATCKVLKQDMAARVERQLVAG